jgi:hypothetical protein
MFVVSEFGFALIQRLITSPGLTRPERGWLQRLQPGGRGI